ncbi:MAG: hypothetical protein U5R06_02370 [candidate division KSB1 bacterium]|nr:hypothetical protein [candidate division KSB1 bacterium]
MDKIFEKYPKYVSFEYRRETDSRTNQIKYYFRIYTSDIGHYQFDNKPDFLNFLDSVISDSILEIKKRKLDNLLIKQAQLENSSYCTMNEIKQLESEINHLSNPHQEGDQCQKQ